MLPYLPRPHPLSHTRFQIYDRVLLSEGFPEIRPLLYMIRTLLIVGFQRCGVFCSILGIWCAPRSLKLPMKRLLRINTVFFVSNVFLVQLGVLRTTAYPLDNTRVGRCLIFPLLPAFCLFFFPSHIIGLNFF